MRPSRFALPFAIIAAGMAYIYFNAERDAGPLTAPNLAAWVVMDITEWPVTRASDIDNLIGHKDAPDVAATELKPHTRVEQSDVQADGSVYARVSLTGLTDDSILGVQYNLKMVPAGGDGWRLDALLKRWQCGRGRSEGMWTIAPCP